MTLIKLLLTGGNADFLFDAIISAAKSSLSFNYKNLVLSNELIKVN